jgi:polysaccharide deacetylase family protein (PEP-CTERM system associated)
MHGPVSRHILTVAVEEYFHVAALRGAVRQEHWSRLEPRLAQGLDQVLELLARFSATATFFVFGRIAETQPELVRRVIDAGHEVASRAYWPRATSGMSRQDFLEDLRRARRALEDAGGNRVLGFRSPTWIGTRELWKLEVLAEEGYLYDASINPMLWTFGGRPESGTIHSQRYGDRTLWEFPVSTVGPSWMRIPFTGGNYIRQFPHALVKRLVAQADRKGIPLVFYLMPWELDTEQPHIHGISRLQQIRHYRNLGKARWVLEDYLRQYRFVGIADFLGVAHPGLEPTVGAVRPVATAAVESTAQPVTLVVPLYNEETNVAYLRRTLEQLRVRVARRYRLHLVLVDDCSRDRTYAALDEQFGSVPDCRVLRHEANRGVAAAIMTGIQHAETEVVCSIDCDCSYDPVVLETMLPLADSADMVTASPYHPHGRVRNVPGWRLFLSKSLSRLYSAVLGARIFTYTSCCRVYQRSRVLPLDIVHGGFLGTAEMLIKLQLAGGRIVEVPATLESRLLGESKMKVARTIRGHLGLLAGLVRWRLGSGSPGIGAAHTLPAVGDRPKPRRVDAEADEGLPVVTVAVPCLNEAGFVEPCLQGILDQDYPRGRLEIIVADGGSADGTREVLERMARQEPRLRVVDNPDRLQAPALNRIIREARGDVIVRMDVHCQYAPDYVRRCVEVLEETGADNVGGAQRAVPRSSFQQALCAALGSPLGVGGARYRSAANEGFVDTVFLGAFRRRVFETVGLYDPRAVTNEDAELNQRLLDSGGRVYLSRNIVVHYHPRDSFGAVARQYFRYGRGRARTFLKHGRLRAVRPALPFLMMVTALLLLLAPPLRHLDPSALAAYAAVILLEAIRVGRRLGLATIMKIALIFPILHVSHGSGFAVGLAKYLVWPDWEATERLPTGQEP